MITLTTEEFHSIVTSNPQVNIVDCFTRINITYNGVLIRSIANMSSSTIKECA